MYILGFNKITLNFIHPLYVNTYFYSIVVSFIFFSSSPELNLVFYDYYSRSQPNEFFINTLYFFWTNTWYLYSFLLIYFIYILFSFLKNKQTYLLTSLLLILLTLFVTDFNIYWNLNNSLGNINLYSSNFNQLLTNSINKYHPFIFYLTFLVSIAFIKCNSIYKSNFKTSCNFIYSINFLLSTKTNYLLLLYTLYLGSWWALQEGSWGGWWNWDPSEVFGLAILYVYLLSIHSYISNMNTFRLDHLYKYLTYMTLIIYFFIQLNFRLVSHNFGTKVMWFIDTDQFNVIVLLILLLTFIILVKVTRKNYFILYTVNLLCGGYVLNNNPKRNYTRAIFYILITVQLILSFAVIFNDFCWKFFKLNLFNNISTTNIDTTIFLFILYFSIEGLNYLYNRVILLFYLLWDISLNQLMLYCFSLKLNKILIYHFSIVSVIFISYLSSNYVLSIWNLSDLEYSTFSKLSLNSNYIELVNSYTYNYFLKPDWFNMFNLSETSETLKSFYLPTTHSYSIQELFTGSNNLSFSIKVFDIYVHYLNLLFITSFLWLLHQNNTKLIILF